MTLVPGVLSIPWLSVIALLVIVVSWLVLRRTVLGVHIYAVGGNESAARLAGIKVWAVLIFVYGVSGLLAGLGGAIIVPIQTAVLDMGLDALILAFVVVVFGGLGSLQGALVGALIVAIVRTAGIQFFPEIELAAVEQGDRDARSTLDDVGVGHHDAVAVDDEARAQGLRRALGATMAFSSHQRREGPSGPQAHHQAAISVDEHQVAVGEPGGRTGDAHHRGKAQLAALITRTPADLGLTSL